MILSDWECPVHGLFESTAPPHVDSIPCPVCDAPSPWRPSPVHGRVRRVEVVRGRWSKPERPTYYNTQALGEGQDPAEWRASRAKVWDEKRKAEVMQIARET